MVTDRVISTRAKGSKFEGTGYYVQYIHNRIKNHKNFLAVVVGGTGTGKSYAALDLMYLLAQDRFNMNNVCFRAKEFVARINSGELHTGDVLLWDESGVDLNSKQWASLANRIVNLILQTFRHRSLIVIFTIPYLSFLDSDTRKLLHSMIETQKIDYEEETTTLKPLLIQINQESGKMYRKYLRVKGDSGFIMPVKRIKTSLPPKNVLAEYEVKKNSFTTDLNEEVGLLLEKLEKKDRFRSVAKNTLTAKQEEILKLYKELGTITKVAEKLGICTTIVGKQLESIRKKLNLDVLPKKNEVFEVERV